jgi:hypothetical protein
VSWHWPCWHWLSWHWVSRIGWVDTGWVDIGWVDIELTLGELTLSWHWSCWHWVNWHCKVWMNEWAYWKKGFLKKLTKRATGHYRYSVVLCG